MMNSKQFFFTLLFVVLSVNINAQDTNVWDIDKSHSSISFSISHFKIATIKGNFKDFSGTITSKNDDFTKGEVNVVIKTASINTNQEARDKHLRSADFFNAEVNPEITFKSTSIEKKSEKEYVVKGNLTVNGITKEFEFIGDYKGSFVHPRFKKTIAVFNFSGVLPRLDYKIGEKFPTAAMGGDVAISINLELTKK